MALEFRQFDVARDLDKQRDLFDLSFPENLNSSVSSREHFFWKFSSLRAICPSYQFVAISEDDILGYYAAIPFKYKIGDSFYNCGMVCDVMTHPKARGQGVFTKIGAYATTELAKMGMDFTTGYPIRPEVMPGHIKVGWQKVLKMPMYIRLIRLNTLLPSYIRIFSYILNPLLLLLSSITRISISRPSSKYTVDILNSSELFSYGEELENFLKNWNSEQSNALVKTINFIKWRTNAPTTLYKFALTKQIENKAIVGLSVLRPTNLKGVEVLAILDIMILKKDTLSANNLFYALVDLAKQLKKDALVCMTTSVWAKKYKFFSNLFLITPAIFTLIIKKLNPKIRDEELFDEKRWHLFWFDSDDL